MRAFVVCLVAVLAVVAFGVDAAVPSNRPSLLRSTGNQNGENTAILEFNGVTAMGGVADNVGIGPQWGVDVWFWRTADNTAGYLFGSAAQPLTVGDTFESLSVVVTSGNAVQVTVQGAASDSGLDSTGQPTATPTRSVTTTGFRVPANTWCHLYVEQMWAAGSSATAATQDTQLTVSINCGCPASASSCAVVAPRGANQLSLQPAWDPFYWHDETFTASDQGGAPIPYLSPRYRRVLLASNGQTSSAAAAQQFAGYLDSLRLWQVTAARRPTHATGCTARITDPRRDNSADLWLQCAAGVGGVLDQAQLTAVRSVYASQLVFEWTFDVNPVYAALPTLAGSPACFAADTGSGTLTAPLIFAGFASTTAVADVTRCPKYLVPQVTAAAANNLYPVLRCSHCNDPHVRTYTQAGDLVRAFDHHQACGGPWWDWAFQSREYQSSTNAGVVCLPSGVQAGISSLWQSGTKVFAGYDSASWLIGSPIYYGDYQTQTTAMGAGYLTLPRSGLTLYWSGGSSYTASAPFRYTVEQGSSCTNYYFSAAYWATVSDATAGNRIGGFCYFNTETIQTNYVYQLSSAPYTDSACTLAPASCPTSGDFCCDPNGARKCCPDGSTASPSGQCCCAVPADADADFWKCCSPCAINEQCSQRVRGGDGGQCSCPCRLRGDSWMTDRAGALIYPNANGDCPCEEIYDRSDRKKIVFPDATLHKCPCTEAYLANPLPPVYPDASNTCPSTTPCANGAARNALGDCPCTGLPAAAPTIYPTTVYKHCPCDIDAVTGAPGLVMPVDVPVKKCPCSAPITTRTLASSSYAVCQLSSTTAQPTCSGGRVCIPTTRSLQGGGGQVGGPVDADVCPCVGHDAALSCSSAAAAPSLTGQCCQDPVVNASSLLCQCPPENGKVLRGPGSVLGQGLECCDANDMCCPYTLDAAYRPSGGAFCPSLDCPVRPRPAICAECSVALTLDPEGGVSCNGGTWDCPWTASMPIWQNCLPDEVADDFCITASGAALAAVDQDPTLCRSSGETRTPCPNSATMLGSGAGSCPAQTCVRPSDAGWQPANCPCVQQTCNSADMQAATYCADIARDCLFDAGNTGAAADGDTSIVSVAVENCRDLCATRLQAAVAAASAAGEDVDAVYNDPQYAICRDRVRCPNNCGGDCQGSCVTDADGSSNAHCECAPGWSGPDCGTAVLDDCFTVTDGAQDQLTFGQVVKDRSVYWYYSPLELSPVRRASGLPLATSGKAIVALHTQTQRAGAAALLASLPYLFQDPFAGLGSDPTKLPQGVLLPTAPSSRSHLVIVLDSINNGGSGGLAKLRIRLVSPVTGAPIALDNSMLQYLDDADTAVSDPVAQGWRDFTLTWTGSDNAGLILGPLPNSTTTPYCVEVQQMSGSDALPNGWALASAPLAGKCQTELRTLNLAVLPGFFSAGFKVCAGDCPTPCQYSNCSSCLADPQCGWCDGFYDDLPVKAGYCMPGTDAGPAAGYQCQTSTASVTAGTAASHRRWRRSTSTTVARVLEVSVGGANQGSPVYIDMLSVYLPPTGAPLALSLPVAFPCAQTVIGGQVPGAPVSTSGSTVAPRSVLRMQSMILIEASQENAPFLASFTGAAGSNSDFLAYLASDVYASTRPWLSSSAFFVGRFKDRRTTDAAPWYPLGSRQPSEVEFDYADAGTPLDWDVLGSPSSGASLVTAMRGALSQYASWSDPACAGRVASTGVGDASACFAPNLDKAYGVGVMDAMLHGTHRFIGAPAAGQLRTMIFVVSSMPAVALADQDVLAGLPLAGTARPLLGKVYQTADFSASSTYNMVANDLDDVTEYLGAGQPEDYASVAQMFDLLLSARIYPVFYVTQAANALGDSYNRDVVVQAYTRLVNKFGFGRVCPGTGCLATLDAGAANSMGIAMGQALDLVRGSLDVLVYQEVNGVMQLDTSGAYVGSQAAPGVLARVTGLSEGATHQVPLTLKRNAADGTTYSEYDDYHYGASRMLLYPMPWQPLMVKPSSVDLPVSTTPTSFTYNEKRLYDSQLKFTGYSPYAGQAVRIQITRFGDADVAWRGGLYEYNIGAAFNTSDILGDEIVAAQLPLFLDDQQGLGSVQRAMFSPATDYDYGDMDNGYLYTRLYYRVWDECAASADEYVLNIYVLPVNTDPPIAQGQSFDGLERVPWGLPAWPVVLGTHYEPVLACLSAYSVDEYRPAINKLRPRIHVYVDGPKGPREAADSSAAQDESSWLPARSDAFFHMRWVDGGRAAGKPLKSDGTPDYDNKKPFTDEPTPLDDVMIDVSRPLRPDHDDGTTDILENFGVYELRAPRGGPHGNNSAGCLYYVPPLQSATYREPWGLPYAKFQFFAQSHYDDGDVVLRSADYTAYINIHPAVYPPVVDVLQPFWAYEDDPYVVVAVGATGYQRTVGPQESVNRGDVEVEIQTPFPVAGDLFNATADLGTLLEAPITASDPYLFSSVGYRRFEFYYRKRDEQAASTCGVAYDSDNAFCAYQDLLPFDQFNFTATSNDGNCLAAGQQSPYCIGPQSTPGTVTVKIIPVNDIPSLQVLPLQGPAAYKNRLYFYRLVGTDIDTAAEKLNLILPSAPNDGTSLTPSVWLVQTLSDTTANATVVDVYPALVPQAAAALRDDINYAGKAQWVLATLNSIDTTVPYSWFSLVTDTLNPAMIQRALAMSRSVRGRALDERAAPPELLAQFIDKIFPTVVTQVTVLPANQLPRISFQRAGVVANGDKDSDTDPDWLLDVSTNDNLDMPIEVSDPDVSFNPVQCRVAVTRGNFMLAGATDFDKLQNLYGFDRTTCSATAGMWREPCPWPTLGTGPGYPQALNITAPLNLPGSGYVPINVVLANVIWRIPFGPANNVDSSDITVTCNDFGKTGCNCDQDQTGLVVARLRVRRQTSSQIGIIGPTVGSVGGLAVIGGATVVGIAGLYYGLRRLRVIKKLDSDPFDEAGFAGATENPTFEGTNMETVNPAFEAAQ